jgi:hypothetical protein
MYPNLLYDVHLPMCPELLYTYLCLLSCCTSTVIMDLELLYSVYLPMYPELLYHSWVAVHYTHVFWVALHLPMYPELLCTYPCILSCCAPTHVSWVAVHLPMYPELLYHSWVAVHYTHVSWVAVHLPMYPELLCTYPCILSCCAPTHVSWVAVHLPMYPELLYTYPCILSCCTPTHVSWVAAVTLETVDFVQTLPVHTWIGLKKIAILSLEPWTSWKKIFFDGAGWW